MRTMKVVAVFVAAFVLAWITIFTFVQTPFLQTVPVKIFWYQTRPYPIYCYLMSALAVGLLFGGALAAYAYVALSVQVARVKREIQRERDLSAKLREQIDTLSTIRNVPAEPKPVVAGADRRFPTPGSRELPPTASREGS